MKNYISYFLLSILFFSSNFVISQNQVPEWSKGVVWYQIFPERFANGDSLNDPDVQKTFAYNKEYPDGWKITPWTSNWFQRSEWEKSLGGKLRDHLTDRRYGGDLQGIIDRLDYIKSLGIGAIYLNPVFESISLHKYDGSSYHHIDVNFGPEPKTDIEQMEKEIPDDISTWQNTKADSLFFKLVEEVHQRGMRIIIDGVFNHTGREFWAFKDIIKNGRSSKYADWYIVRAFDNPATIRDEFEYKGWWNVRAMPEFNRTKEDLHAGPKQYIFNSTKKWMDPNGDGDPSDGIDGWRLDVAREVPIGFWKDWRKLVKSLNPEAIIVGELWELSPDFISEDGAFDALMNYNFAFAVNDFFIAEKKKIGTTQFINKLKEIVKTYPETHLDILQNLIGSHDTERLSSMIVNPDRRFETDADERNKNYNPGKPDRDHYNIQKMIAAFQMTYKGAPMIYYGDEVGMWGADDPHDRKPMIWDDLKYDGEIIVRESGFRNGFGIYTVEQNKDLLEFYKAIINVRNNNIALKRGFLNFIYSNDKNSCFAFERVLGNQKVIAVFNTGKKDAQFEIPSGFMNVSYKNLLTNEEDTISGGKLPIDIDPKSFEIIRIYDISRRD